MRIKLLIVFVGMSLNSFAQDPILFDTPWHLQDLIINNISNPPPSNDEITDIILSFSSENNLFGSHVCE